MRASDFALAENWSSAKKLSISLEIEISDTINVVEVLKLSELQDVKREEGKLVEEESKTHDKVNLALISGNDELSIEEYRESFILSQDRNLRD